jgi:uncharacterized membrane protein
MHLIPVLAVSVGLFGCVVIAVVFAVLGGLAGYAILRNNPKYKAWLDAEAAKVVGPPKGSS